MFCVCRKSSSSLMMKSSSEVEITKSIAIAPGNGSTSSGGQVIDAQERAVIFSFMLFQVTEALTVPRAKIDESGQKGIAEYIVGMGYKNGYGNSSISSITGDRALKVVELRDKPIKIFHKIFTLESCNCIKIFYKFLSEKEEELNSISNVQEQSSSEREMVNEIGESSKELGKRKTKSYWRYIDHNDNSREILNVRNNCWNYCEKFTDFFVLINTVKRSGVRTPMRRRKSGPDPNEPGGMHYDPLSSSDIERWNAEEDAKEAKEALIASKEKQVRERETEYPKIPMKSRAEEQKERGLTRVLGVLASVLNDFSHPAQRNQSKRKLKPTRTGRTVKVPSKKPTESRPKKELTKEQRAHIWNNEGSHFEATKFKLVIIPKIQNLPIKDIALVLSENLKIKKSELAAITRAEEIEGYICLINVNKFTLANPNGSPKCMNVTLQNLPSLLKALETMLKKNLNKESERFNLPAYIALKVIRDNMNPLKMDKMKDVMHITEAELLSENKSGERVPTLKSGINEN